MGTSNELSLVIRKVTIPVMVDMTNQVIRGGHHIAGLRKIVSGSLFGFVLSRGSLKLGLLFEAVSLSTTTSCPCAA